MTTAASTRHVPLDTVANFRDLGGYPTADGRTTRWRTLYRSDGLGQLSTEDLNRLRALELRTVVDLRTADELTQRGRFPVDQHPVRFHHVSLIDRTWDLDEARRENLPPAEFLHRQYRRMLDETGDRFAAAIELLADHDGVPAVFHCAAGKDRTGLLAALILGAVGVDRRTIVEDYALTGAAMERILARAAEDPTRAEKIADVPTSFFSADPVGMERVLDDIEDEHGSVRDYVRWLGVADDTLAHLDHVLVTDEA